MINDIICLFYYCFTIVLSCFISTIIIIRLIIFWLRIITCNFVEQLRLSCVPWQVCLKMQQPMPTCKLQDLMRVRRCYERQVLFFWPRHDDGKTTRTAEITFIKRVRNNLFHLAHRCCILCNFTASTITRCAEVIGTGRKLGEIIKWLERLELDLERQFIGDLIWGILFVVLRWYFLHRQRLISVESWPCLLSLSGFWLKPLVTSLVGPPNVDSFRPRGVMACCGVSGVNLTPLAKYARSMKAHLWCWFASHALPYVYRTAGNTTEDDQSFASWRAKRPRGLGGVWKA